MTNENSKLIETDTVQQMLSLPDLAERVRLRETEIDKECFSALTAGSRAVELALEQGDDLLLAKHKCGHGPFLEWLETHFPKSPRQARNYMSLALKVPQRKRASIFEDAKSVRDAFRILGLLPEVETTQPTLPGLPVNPAISRLNWLAEWTTKSGDEISTWEPQQRQELKITLRPVIELYSKL